MRFERGKITGHIVGPRWRVKHRSPKIATVGLFELVGAADPDEAAAKVLAAYAGPRVIISIEPLAPPDALAAHTKV